MTASISSLVIGLFRFSISSCSSFCSFWLSRNASISLDCLTCWHIAVHNMFLKSLDFLGVGSDLSFLFHDFINLNLLSLLFNKVY